MAEPKDTLLREVDEALRADRVANLWQEYRGTLLAVIIAAVVFAAAFSIWQAYQKNQAEAAMAKFDAAITLFQNGERAKAETAFAGLAKAGSGEKRDLAQLWQARVLEAMGREKDAVPVLTQVAQSSAGDLLWRDIACLRLMGLSADLPASCTAGDDSPLRPMRDEWRAGQLWKEGKVKEARALLAVIANSEGSEVNRGQRERAAALLAVMSEEK